MEGRQCDKQAEDLNGKGVKLRPWKRVDRCLLQTKWPVSELTWSSEDFTVQLVITDSTLDKEELG